MKVFSENFHFLLIHEKCFPVIFSLIQYKLSETEIYSFLCIADGDLLFMWG